MTDDELIERMAEAILTASVPYRGPGGQTVPYVMPVHVDMARAALAVARPAIRNETLDEAASSLDLFYDQEHRNAQETPPGRTFEDTRYLDGIEAAERIVRSLRSDSEGDSE